VSGVRVSPPVQITNNMIKYIKESFEELSNHVTWVSRDEAQKSTVVVAVFTIIFALAVFAVDYVFQLGLDNFFTMFNN
jgi:preprotein translocase subunit SecE